MLLDTQKDENRKKKVMREKREMKRNRDIIQVSEIFIYICTGYLGFSPIQFKKKKEGGTPDIVFN